MISLLIGMGALFLAVIVASIIDPWPPPPRENIDDPSPTMTSCCRSTRVRHEPKPPPEHRPGRVIRQMELLSAVPRRINHHSASQLDEPLPWNWELGSVIGSPKGVAAALSRSALSAQADVHLPLDITPFCRAA
jgi:hypothetical protein